MSIAGDDVPQELVDEVERCQVSALQAIQNSERSSRPITEGHNRQVSQTSMMTAPRCVSFAAGASITRCNIRLQLTGHLVTGREQLTGVM
jgi:hypothetical protein